jgi:hypothetical protein
MVCETYRKPRQTAEQRADEVRAVKNKVMAGLLQKTVKVVVSPTGAVVFNGITEAEKQGVTDACIYRHIMVAGAATVKAEIARQAMLQGRQIKMDTVNAGTHSHDGGKTWHPGH